MKNLLLIPLIILISGLAIAEDDFQSLTDMNYEWYLKNSKEIEKTLISGTDNNAIPTINVIGLIWKHRDGAIWIAVAPAISNAFIYKTKLMLLWFSQYPDEYTSWLKNMPTALFTAWSGKNSDMENLEKLRIKMINHLKVYKTTETNYELKEMCLELIETLEKTKVSKVE